MIVAVCIIVKRQWLKVSLNLPQNRLIDSFFLYNICYVNFLLRVKIKINTQFLHLIFLVLRLLLILCLL